MKNTTVNVRSFATAKLQAISRRLIAIAIIAVIGFTMFACASLFPKFGEVLGSAEALKEYLESQPANSPDAPLEITVKNINAAMLKDVADILRSTDKYISLKLEAPALAILKIEDSAFRDCKSLTNLDLYSSCAYTIGNDAFRGCANLASLRLPYELSDFSQTARTALADCPSLTAIEANSCKLYSSSEGVLFDKEKKLLIFFPRGKTGPFTVPGSVWTIAPYAFYGSKITSVTMSGGYGLNLQRGTMDYFGIDDNAFINCSNLTTVTIKGAAQFRNDNAFDGNLEDVYNATGKAIMKDGKQIGVDIETLGGTFTREIGSDKWSVLSFSSGFLGKWKRDNFGNTLTFSATSFTDSAQPGSKCNLMGISDNSYTCYWESDYREFTLTFRLVSGNIVIEGDSGNDMRNWNGTWKKQ